QHALSRRQLLAGGSAALAAATVPGLGGSHAPSAAAQDNQVLISVGGGAWERAQDIAYFQPFTEETGIEVVKAPSVEIAQIRAMVETGNVTYDVSSGMGAGIVYTLAEEGLLEPIDYSPFEQESLDGMFPEGKHEFGVASLLYSLIMGYNTDTFGDSGPADWAEFWDLGGFEGPRTLGTGIDSGTCTWELALLADGVAPEDLYPIDFDRALTSLDRVRDDIVTWWDLGGVPAQLLTDGQVNLASAWNGRIQALIDEGLPATINWNQGILQWDLMFVLKGAPNPDNAMQLLAFMSRAETQAVFAENIAYAPSNSNAYEFIPEERAAILPTAPDLMEQQIPQDFAFWDSDDPETGQKMLDIAAERWNEWLIG
ncbi:MAG: ABC transporter substrate-binding protein, partial [Thermomicrobiales bacterium]